jgi:hypothetical protein
VPERW